MIRRLVQITEGLPLWAQILIALFLVGFSIATVLGRFKPQIGSKLFSKIPPEEIRTNIGHIVQYTVIPVIVTAVYLFVLYTIHIA